MPRKHFTSEAVAYICRLYRPLRVPSLPVPPGEPTLCATERQPSVSVICLPSESLPDVTPTISSLDPVATKSILGQELQFAASDDQLVRISDGIDQLARGQHAAQIALQEELERNRGEAARIRGDIDVIGKQVENRAQFDNERSNIERLPIAPGASYDEFQGCMKDTRTAVIEHAVGFLNAEDIGEKRILLLFGCAGCGKTAIAHTVARICRQDHHNLGSSFFFRAGQNLLDTPAQLVSTIARELSVQNTAYAYYLSNAIAANPSITRGPLTNQFQTLLLHPSSAASLQSRPTAIVIDAIDEGWSEQLLYILKLCSKLPSWIRIFVTLRDDGFILPQLRSQSHILREEIEINTKTNHQDIRTYISERLRTIARDREIDNWPTEHVVDRMCAAANGLFVWAAVACNSIADIDLDPLEQYEELLSGVHHRDTRASVQMDVLYRKVLSKCRLDEPRALLRYRQSLGTVLALKRPLSVSGHNELIGETHTQYTLRPLIPVFLGLANQHPPQPIQIIHQSFRDFVTQGGDDASLTEKYTIVESEHNESLALYCLALISKEMPLLVKHTEWITDEDRDLGDKIPEIADGVVSEALWYACEHVADHVQAVNRRLPSFSDALAHFMRNDVYGWLAICAMKGKFQGVEKMWDLSQQIDDDSRPAVDHELLAGVLMMLSESLVIQNRREEALVAATESTTLVRLLVGTEAEEIETLAKALFTLSYRLADLGYHEQSLQALRESEGIFRGLSKDRPGIYDYEHAKTLSTLSIRLAQLKRHEEGLAPARESVHIFRNVAKDRPNHILALADALNSLTIQLSACRYYEEALASARESVDIARDVASDSTAPHNIMLANALNTLACQFANLGRTEEALTSERQSVDLFRNVAREHPFICDDYLANSLSCLCSQLSALGRHEEALPPARESASLLRDLASDHGTVYNPHLANSLCTLSMVLLYLGRHEEALVTICEAETVYRECERDLPNTYNSSLVQFLGNTALKLRNGNPIDETANALKEYGKLYQAISKDFSLCLSYRTERFNPQIQLT